MTGKEKELSLRLTDEFIRVEVAKMHEGHYKLIINDLAIGYYTTRVEALTSAAVLVECVEAGGCPGGITPF